MNICVIGAGTYGSYIINSILEKHPEVNITVFDVGGPSIKSELEVGYVSILKDKLYKGLSDGRWFGFGGSSKKWGGQILTFSKNDFSNPSNFMKDVVSLNEKYRELVFRKLKINNKNTEKKITDELFLKRSVWLSYFKRDLFKKFKIGKRNNVNIISQARITHLESFNGNSKIKKVRFIHNGEKKEAIFDFYFLAAGAFECGRILLNSNLLESNKLMFTDHIAQKVFRIKSGTVIGREDFVYQLKGASIITKRFVGEIDNYSFYVHPVLNTDFPFFQSLKKILFRGEYELENLKNLFLNIPELIKFGYHAIIKREIYVLDGEWYLNIDIENPTTDSYIKLSEQRDEFGEFGLDVYYRIGDKSEYIYDQVINLVKNHLESVNVEFDLCEEKISVDKSEDTYHPFNMFSGYNSVDEYFNAYENLLIVNTGILERSGGINPTAAVFPLIEEFISYKFKLKSTLDD